VLDFSDAALHAPQGMWQAIVEGVARPDAHFVLREPSAWARGAMGLLGGCRRPGASSAWHCALLVLS